MEWCRCEVNQIADSSGYLYLTPNTSYFPNGQNQGTWRDNGVVNGTINNNRMQIVLKNIARVGASAPGTSSNNPTFLIKEYCYGPETTAPSPTIPGCGSQNNADNGNIVQILDTLNGNNSQSFSYDILNRLEFFTNGDGSMSQTYGIDPWGNMTQSGTSTFSVDYDGNNHISATGIGYDAAGNLTSFNNGVLTNTYAYDAESRLSNVNNGGQPTRMMPMMIGCERMPAATGRSIGASALTEAVALLNETHKLQTA